MATTKKPAVGIGPQTKREAKKTARVTKRADRKIITPLTPAGSAAKRKDRRKGAAAIAGSMIGTIGMIAADARLRRGALRIQDRDKNLGAYNKVEPTRREKWDMGKNKKSTKK